MSVCDVYACVVVTHRACVCELLLDKLVGRQGGAELYECSV
jgi:hypothetical protein